KVTVTDSYPAGVTVNDTAVTLDKNNQFTLSAGENKITATDKAGNVSTVTVTAISGHEDTDNDHKCDYCGQIVSEHVDANRDSICDICGEILSEETTGYIPSDKPVIENSDEGTSADLSSTTKTEDGTTSAEIDKETADKIVANAVENSSGAIVIDATAKTESAAASANTSQIEIPSSALADISEKTDADVTIKTDVGEVIIDNTAAGEIAKNAEGETVQIILSRDKDTNDSVNLEIKVVSSEDKVITDFGEGKVTVTADIDDALKGNDPVCVYIDEDGIYQKVSGALNEDGTFTFTLEHAGTYSVLPKEQADKVIKDQEIAAVKRIKPVVTLTTKNIKRGIKVSVKVPASQKADKTGIIIYRSTKKSSGYAMYKKVKTSGSTYTITNTLNVKGNRLVQGKRYYYKARVYKVIDGKTYYGPMSSIKYIRAK
ncbi:MAG: hypothetical protein PUG51_01315, partial [Firmicutes bacterium]|nr:hypothetical protein [Bacillota bacterium]